ncbi:MAG: acetate kinase [Desulfobacterales bacterium]|nr:acetate kinase [Desulfobacterales bacterium]
MKVLVINSGSSSIKYRLFDMTEKTVLASGVMEQIGETESRLTHHTRNSQGEMEEIVNSEPVADHQAGFQLIGAALNESGALRDTQELSGIGHRVVHGGEEFKQPTLINKKVIDTIRRLSPLAPLHNPANLLGIEVAMQSAPQVPQVAVFDTAFHQSIPAHAFRYAIPQDLYEAHHVRRYGFHGTSHHYVAKQTADLMDRPLNTLNLITLHLGNGASAAAVKGGKSIDTSMGMTPLEGLIMGTRCGDIDPAIIFYLKRKTGLARDAVESILNQESGLKGICGVNDMRQIEELAQSGNSQAQLAIEMVCYRIKKYIGAYYAVLGRLDALVFTAGIGEKSPLIRAGACRGLSHLGIEIDPEKNNRKSKTAFEIQKGGSTVKILVIPTNEEREIAEQTVACIESRRGRNV